MNKLLIIVFSLAPLYTCHASSILDEMRRDTDRLLERKMDELNQERQLFEVRRANDEQERFNRSTIERQRRNAHGR
jgi:hypothetical protein